MVSEQTKKAIQILPFVYMIVVSLVEMFVQVNPMVGVILAVIGLLSCIIAFGIK